jgi:hypothetical protein
VIHAKPWPQEADELLALWGSLTDGHLGERIEACRARFQKLQPALISWTSTNDELPDTDTTVLVHLEDGEVWTGFLDGNTWRFVSSDKIDGEVLHWAHFPQPPTP